MISTAVWQNGTRVDIDEGKKEIFKKILCVRNSHTLEHRKIELFQSTEGLLVRPGRVKEAVSFEFYFNKNWNDCKEMWSYFGRKSYPIQGQNDTNAVESQIRVIKHFEKSIFGQRTQFL